MKGFDLLAILTHPQFSQMLVSGLKMTLIIAFWSWTLAMSLGFVLLIIRMLPFKVTDQLVAGYVSYHRNVPTLVQLMLWYFGIANLLPGLLQEWLGDHQGETLFAIIGLGRARPQLSGSNDLCADAAGSSQCTAGTDQPHSLVVQKFITGDGDRRG